MLSGLLVIAPMTGCNVFIICWAIHCAAFCIQQEASNGLMQVSVGVVTRMFVLDMAPAPAPERGIDCLEMTAEPGDGEEVPLLLVCTPEVRMYNPNSVRTRNIHAW